VGALSDSRGGLGFGLINYFVFAYVLSALNA